MRKAIMYITFYALLITWYISRVSAGWLTKVWNEPLGVFQFDFGKFKLDFFVAQLSKLEFMTTTSQNQDRILGSSKSDKVKIAVWDKKLLGYCSAKRCFAIRESAIRYTWIKFCQSMRAKMCIFAFKAVVFMLYIGIVQITFQVVKNNH